MESNTSAKVQYAFRRPRFPIIYAVGNELLAALSPAALQRQLGRLGFQGAKVLDMVDATGEGWAFHSDLMVVSPLTLKKRWKKIDVIRLFNGSDNARRIGSPYPEAYIPRRPLVRIIAEVAALAAYAKPNKPPQPAGARVARLGRLAPATETALPERVMRDPKTDEKNIHLLKLLAQLRDHIDIHRIIGLNAGALREGQISGALLGYLQKSAHESLAIYICKIFESSVRNDLNSIPGIIDSIPAVPVSGTQGRELAAFGKKYGHDAAPTDARSYLKETLDLFRAAHSESLGRLKEFRDTIGAHSDYHAAIASLPPHAEFETLFSFAKEFYEVVSRSINENGPAVIPRMVGRGFIKLIGSLGVQTPRFDFEDEK